jgi:hypothetical protein
MMVNNTSCDVNHEAELERLIDVFQSIEVQHGYTDEHSCDVIHVIQVGNIHVTSYMSYK